MANFCSDHTSCMERLKRLEETQDKQWKVITGILTKLNLILGGIIISPFIVSVLVLLARSNGK